MNFATGGPWIISNQKDIILAEECLITLGVLFLEGPPLDLKKTIEGCRDLQAVEGMQAKGETPRKRAALCFILKSAVSNKHHEGKTIKEWLEKTEKNPQYQQIIEHLTDKEIKQNLASNAKLREKIILTESFISTWIVETANKIIRDI